jgi:hypothetical protein
MGACSFLGCGRKQEAKGLCQYHNKQRRAGLELSPLRTYTRYTPGSPYKWCPGCKTEKLLEEFCKSISKAGGRATYCKVCWNARAKIERDRPEVKARLRASALVRKFNVTSEWVEQKLIEQDYRCAVCREPFTKTPHIDHDHRCCPGKTSCGKCVRGLLCEGHNLGLGKFNDDPRLLLNAVAYLEEYGSILKAA